MPAADDDDEHYKELIPLVDSVKARPEVFATGDYGVRDSALLAEKFVFDHALSLEPTALRHINEFVETLRDSESAPRTRSKTKAANSQAVTKTPPPPIPLFSSTPLDSLYLDGMNSDQIWEQLELKTKNVLKVLEGITPPQINGFGPPDDSSDSEQGDAAGEKDGGELDMDLDMADNDLYDSSEDSDYEEESITSDSHDSISHEDDAGDDGEESIAPLQPGIDERPDFDLDRPGPSPTMSKRPAHPVLDDGFFSIDDFNRETEVLESRSRSNGRLDEDEDEEDGEIIDYFALMADEAVAFDEEDEDMGSFHPSYKDFFTPPRRLPDARGQLRKGTFGTTDAAKAAAPLTNKEKSPKTNGKSRGVTFDSSVRVKTIKARKNTLKERLELFGRLGMLDIEGDEEAEYVDSDESDESDERDERDVDWDMEDVDQELMSLEDENAGKGGGGSDATESDPDPDSDVGVEMIQRLNHDLFDDEPPGSLGSESAVSTHAKRQAQLAEEIAAFEAENIAQKDWTLMGEATARSRPKNSLLEENLDFERQGGARAAPQVTEESTASLEEKIKARILEARFDDVVRKRPIEDDEPFLPSRFFELDGSKSSRSLAQIYEDEYTAARDGEVIDDRDGRLATEHEEIEKAWNAICYKLDALSNAHFTPKQPTATISAIRNVATASLESALPTAAATTTLLAPEELLAPAKSLSALRNRSELTPAEKRAARTKERKKRKKATEAVKSYMSNRSGKNKSASARKEKDEALRSLVKSGKGVTVVGKDSANLKRAAAPNGKGVKLGKAADKREKPSSPNVDGSRWKL